MFRKLVSNIAFSPALVGQLGFYAKRLSKEEATRRMGLIFTALALIVQSFAVFSPPESANASNPSNFVDGGVSSVHDYLQHYDVNSRHIKDIMTSVGITRAEIKAAKPGTFNSKQVLSWGLTSRFSAAQGERTFTYTKASGGTGTVYYRPLTLWDTYPYTKKNGSTYQGFIGHSAKFGWFAIMKNCGNLITKKAPKPAPKPIAACSALTVDKLSRTSFRFTAHASAKNGAKIKSYLYTIKNKAGKTIQSKTTSAATYTYTQSSTGTYTASLAVNTSVGTKESADCKTSFTVSPPPAVPAAACTNLDASLIGRTSVELTGEASASGGAKISKYVFTIKNKAGKTVATRSVTTNKASVTPDDITLTTPGNYVASLAVSTSVGQKTSAANCTASFTIAKPAVCSLNTQLAANSPDCQPCPGNTSIWIKDVDCKSHIIDTKQAININQNNVDASTTIAQAGDRIAYTINVQNTGLAPAVAPLQENLDDVMEYATIADTGGGTFDENTKTLSWPSVTLQPGQKQSRTFVVKLASTIPAMARGTSDATSYDCIMTNTFGNSINVNVNCPAPKQVEEVVSQLPHTGPTENMLFAGVVFALVAYFYARSRQLKKEVRLIRRDLNAGTL